MIPDVQLDATGLDCPLPILKARKALAGLHSGQVLQVIATDPQSLVDFERFCQQLGHVLLETQQKDGYCFIWLRKG